MSSGVPVKEDDTSVGPTEFWSEQLDLSPRVGVRTVQI